MERRLAAGGDRGTHRHPRHLRLESRAALYQPQSQRQHRPDLRHQWRPVAAPAARLHARTRLAALCAATGGRCDRRPDRQSRVEQRRSAHGQRAPRRRRRPAAAAVRQKRRADRVDIDDARHRPGTPRRRQQQLDLEGQRTIDLDLRADASSIAVNAAQNGSQGAAQQGAQSAAPSAISSSSASTAPSSTVSSSSAPQYGMRFTLGGSYRKAPIVGGGQAGAVLALADADTVYPIEAHATLGKNQIAIAGTLTDPRAPTGLDLRLSLAGASMADLYPLTGVLLPATPAYATHGRLIGKHRADTWDWTYQDFSGTVGGSDLAGTLQYLPRSPRPLLRGAITSQQLRLEDLGPTIGADGNDAKVARGQAPVQPDGKALPVEQFNTAQWGALDADVKFSGKRLVRTHDIPLDNVVAEIHMKDKVLTLTPLDFGMAGGDVTSNISLDGRKSAIAAQVKLAARHLQVRELFPKLKSMQASFGEVNGDAALTGHGNSVSTMLATSNGEAAAVVSNGSVSHFILEAAGLNVANAVFVKLFGDEQVKLNCMISDFAVTNGRADTRRFVLDTDNAVVNVNGDVDLTRETLNLDVRPETKGARILSLRSPLYAQGTFAHPDVGPYKGPLALKSGAAVALASAVTPLAALLPLVNLHKAPDTDCAAALAQAEATRAAPKSPPTAAPAKPLTSAQLEKARDMKR